MAGCCGCEGEEVFGSCYRISSTPQLYPGVGEILRITQQELAYLVGLSRQRVNEALASLEAQGAIRVEYGGLRVLNLKALRSTVFLIKTAPDPGVNGADSY